MNDKVIVMLIVGSVIYLFAIMGVGEWVHRGLSGLETRPRNSFTFLLGVLWPLTLLIVLVLGTYEGISGRRVELRWLP